MNLFWEPDKMKLLLQNSPLAFQTSDMKTLAHLKGIFKIGDGDGDDENGELAIEIDENMISLNDGQGYKYRLEILPKYIGGGIWLSSIAMLFNIERFKDIFAGTAVLELGAGLGIPGMHVANYAKNVTLSDTDLDVTIASAAVNNEFLVKTIDVRYLDWDNPLLDIPAYDVIIACDCIYRTTHHGVFDAIDKILNPDSGILMMCNIFRDGLDDFLYLVEERFEEVTLEEQTLIYNDEYECNVVFMIAKRKR